MVCARIAALAVACSLGVSTVTAQAPAPAHSPRYVISVGDYPNVRGVRLNFRDCDLERVDGVNVTVWEPYEPASGIVNGVAFGLPVTGAGDIHGLATGVFGVGVTHDIRGLMLAPIGGGAGGRVHGIAVGGVGIGAGGDLEGIVIGGIGAGAGGNATGLLAGGIGAGVAGNLRGAAVGLVGVGAGGDATGLLFGGVGAGIAGSVKGIMVGGIGIGAGGDITGAALGGIGVGAGATIHGIAIGGIGVGAKRLEGGFAALAVGAKHATAIVLAPAYFRIVEDGSFRGASVSAVNYLQGSQSGVTIGLFNYARSVHGMQIGIVNVIADREGHRVLPVINW